MPYGMLNTLCVRHCIHHMEAQEMTLICSILHSIQQAKKEK
jgi:hypothetical protein